MQGKDAFAQRVEIIARSLDQQQQFRILPDVTFPTIGRGDAGDAIDAGGQTFFDERLRNRIGDGFVRTRTQDENGIGHSKLSTKM